MTYELDPILAVWFFLGIFGLLSLAAIVLRAKKAQRLAKARAVHPAGKGLTSPPVHTGWLAERPLPVEPTRHIDRAGFDWTK